MDRPPDGAGRARLAGAAAVCAYAGWGAVDAFEEAIHEKLRRLPTMPATVIAERVGWTRGITVFKARVGELRPAYLPVDPASPTSYGAGNVAPCDLRFPPIELRSVRVGPWPGAAAGVDHGDRLLALVVGAAHRPGGLRTCSPVGGG